jgi:hypothetical protein
MAPADFPVPRPCHPGEEARFVAAGASEWVQLPKGTQILVHEGRLRLHEPAVWLADTMWQPVLWLHAGQAHQLDRHGWVRLEAGERCVLHLQIKPSPWQRLSAAAAGCIAAVHRVAVRWAGLPNTRQSDAAAGRQSPRVADNC